MTGIAGNSAAVVSLLRGQLGKALEIINDAVRLADQSPGRQGHRFPPHIARGFILVELDLMEEARSAFDTDRRKEGPPLALLAIKTPVARNTSSPGSGRRDRQLEAGVGLADETGSKYTLAYSLSVLSLMSFHRNDLSLAAEAANAAVGQLAETGARYRTQWVMWAQALLLEAHGEVAEAFSTLAGCWDQCAAEGLALDYRMLGADLVRLALARGEQGRARDVAAAVTESPMRTGRSPHLPALRCAAGPSRRRCRGPA